MTRLRWVVTGWTYETELPWEHGASHHGFRLFGVLTVFTPWNQFILVDSEEGNRVIYNTQESWRAAMREIEDRADPLLRLAYIARGDNEL